MWSGAGAAIRFDFAGSIATHYADSREGIGRNGFVVRSTLAKGFSMSWCTSLLLGVSLLGVGQAPAAQRPRLAFLPGSNEIESKAAQQPPKAAGPDSAADDEAALVQGASLTTSFADSPLGFTGPAHNGFWPEVWGFAGVRGIYAGTRMAPNGLAYNPLAAADLDLNIGLLPLKKLYLFSLTNFWLQRATDGQTHGNWDFTKREFDVTVGAAWNYWGRLELRGFGYAYNNLNRGLSPLVPHDYNDGIGLENRYYLANTDIYDVSKLGFLSAGYLPTKTLVGGNGDDFRPGFFARAYVTCDLNFLGSYVFLDSQMICERAFVARLVSFDGGLALRPCPSLAGLEFRVGGTETLDVQVNVNRTLGYIAVRLLF
jgi:hypothetical protein